MSLRRRLSSFRWGCCHILLFDRPFLRGTPNRGRLLTYSYFRPVELGGRHLRELRQEQDSYRRGYRIHEERNPGALRIERTLL